MPYDSTIMSQTEFDHLTKEWNNEGQSSNLNLIVFFILMYPIIWNLWREIIGFCIVLPIILFLIFKVLEYSVVKNKKEYIIE